MYDIQRLPELGPLVEQYYPNDTLNIMKRKFGPRDYDRPAIYFDHKVAVTTFGPIYLLGKVPNRPAYGSLFRADPSREKIEQLVMAYESSPWATNSNQQ